MQLEKSQLLIQTLFQICRKQCVLALANKKKTNKHKKREKSSKKKKTEMWEVRYCDCRCKKRQSETCKNNEDHSALQTDRLWTVVFVDLHNETNAKLLTIKLEAEAGSKNYSRAHSLIIFNTQKDQKQKPRIILPKKQAHHSWRVLSGSWFWLEPFGSGL